MAIKLYGGGPNPPVRLDKWQNIVGVSWGESDAGEYIAALFEVATTYTQVNAGGSCSVDVQQWTEEDVWAQAYLSSLRWRSFGAVAVYSRGEDGTWGELDWFPDELDVQNETTLDVTETFGAWEIVGTLYSSGSVNANTIYSSRGIPKWESAGSASTGVSVPTFPELTFDQSISLKIQLASDVFTGGLECARVTVGGTATTRARSTGVSVEFAPANNPYETSQPPHSDASPDFASMKLVEDGGREWLPVAAKIVDQRAASFDEPNGTTGKVFILFKRQEEEGTA